MNRLKFPSSIVQAVQHMMSPSGGLVTPRAPPAGVWVQARVPRRWASSGPTKDPRRTVEPMSRKTLAGTAVLGAGLLGFLYYLKRKKEFAIDQERKRLVGKASLGGRFELVDTEGRKCTSDDLLGQWLLLYFGFTHCPDICPDELEKMAEAVDIVAATPKLPGVQPVFITVDPERDSVQAVKEYVKEFHPRLLGLTGTVEQVKQACRAYRVYFSEGPRDEDNDYIVDHTIIMYLIDPDGQFVDYYGQTKTAEQVAASVTVNMAKYNKLKKGTLW